MGKWDKKPRCHDCTTRGEARWDGYCRQHAPALADCPKCGARGFPKYKNHCERCWGVADNTIDMFRENFFEDPTRNNDFSPTEFGLDKKSFSDKLER